MVSKIHGEGVENIRYRYNWCRHKWAMRRILITGKTNIKKDPDNLKREQVVLPTNSI